MTFQIDRERKPVFSVLFAWVLLIGGIIAHTYLNRGVVESLRAATSFVMPLSLIWLIVLASGIWCVRRGSFKLGLAYLLLWVMIAVAFNSRTARYAIRQIEGVPPAPLADRTELPLRSVVVLGGGVYVNSSGTPELNRDGHRVFTAASLWHSGQTDSIICTGERAGVDHNQSEIARRLLKSVGVPDSVIYEIGGENTTQEMRILKNLLDNPPGEFKANGPVGLVTSAFHMPRALRLAKDNELELVPIPCCFRHAVTNEFVASDLIPTSDAGARMGLAIKEFLARLVGR